MKKYIIILFTIYLTLFSCANNQPPSGGPQDTTPPEVLKFSPSNKALNFNGERIELEFSKYMDKRAVAQNIFITPEVKYKLDWSGKDLEIEFEEELKANTSYALTIGTEYTDRFKNKPAKAFNLIFSTGDILDSGKIDGRLFAEKSDGVYIYLYNLNDIDPDTLDIRTAKADYFTQCGTSGEFSIQALKDGKYRLIAVEDKFKNSQYDEDSDSFSASLNDIEVKDGMADGVKIKLGKIIDKQAPALFSARSESDDVLSVQFSEKINLEKLDKIDIEIKDSLETETFYPKYIFADKEKESKLYLVLKEKMDTSKLWSVNFTGDLPQDTLGNIMHDSLKQSNFFKFRMGEFLEKLELTDLDIKDSSTRNDRKIDFLFDFNMPVNKVIAESCIILKDMYKDSLIESSYQWTDDSKLLLKSKELLEEKTWYQLEIKKGIKSYNNLILSDTTKLIRFQTGSDNKDESSVSGELIGNDDNKAWVIVLKSENKNAEEYQILVDSDNKFEFPNVKAGRYNIELYKDDNGNMEYDFGTSMPYSYAEEFKVINQSINVRARWPIVNLKINLNK